MRFYGKISDRGLDSNKDSSSFSAPVDINILTRLVFDYFSLVFTKICVNSIFFFFVIIVINEKKMKNSSTFFPTLNSN